MKTRTNITYAACTLIALACFALCPAARAQLPPPPPDGGYPGQNTAEGEDALFILDTSQGFSNTAVGWEALRGLTTGSGNTAIGYAALNLAMNSASYNIAIGYNSGLSIFDGSNNIDIGNLGQVDDSATIRIGTKGTHQRTLIAGIYGVSITNGLGVTIDRFGHLGTVTSSARFKENIQPMDKTSEAVLSLKPVIFRYKKEIDEGAIPQFGLIAEEVAKVDPDLVIKDENGKAYSVRYEAVNAMLLNEFLKEHKAFVEEQRKVQEQGATIARQQKQVEALTAGVQKVSAQLELRKSAPETVSYNH